MRWANLTKKLTRQPKKKKKFKGKKILKLFAIYKEQQTVTLLQLEQVKFNFETFQDFDLK